MTKGYGNMTRYGWMAGVLVLSLIMAGCRATVSVPLVAPTRPLAEQVIEGRGTDKILLLDISGFISGTKQSSSLLSKAPSLQDRIRESLQKAEGDAAIKGMILRINSPGGTITATDIVYHEIMRFKRKRGIPVVACMMAVATSGGYYIATAADEIVAHPTTITGSIGVIALKFNVEGLMERLGIENETVTSVALKDLWSPFRAGTQEERTIIQDIIDGHHALFCDTIRRGRTSLTEADVTRLADGRIYSADQALQAGLIDRIGYLDDTIDALKGQLGMEEASIITYFRPGTYRGTIYSGNSVPSPRITTLLPMGDGGWISETGVHFMYLWMP